MNKQRDDALQERGDTWRDPSEIARQQARKIEEIARESERLRVECEGLRKLLAKCRPALDSWKRDGEQRYLTTDDNDVKTYHLKVGPNHYRAMELMGEIDAARGEP